MAATKKTNIIIPEVMEDSISAKLPNAIKFSTLAKMTTELAGRPGDTLSMPVYAYVGDAAIVGEGEAIPVDALTQTKTTATVKKVAKAIGITDEALGAGMDVLNEAEEQAVMAIASKIDADCVAALGTIKTNMTSTITTGKKIDSTAISLALVKFGEEIEGDKVLFVTPAQAHDLREEIKVIPAGTDMVFKGALGMVMGCQVVISGRLPVNMNFIVKPGALRIETKKKVEVELDRAVLEKTTNVVTDQHYVAFLYDESKAIKIVTTP
ncbi:MAG: N4-gp56 family major capsid protein [Cetobacterium sp.]